MIYKDFIGAVNEQISHCLSLLECKQKEYAQSNLDCLIAFKEVANIQGVTTKQALAGLMAKHTVSVYDLIKNDCQDLNLWDEKITDHINYLLILKAILEEEQSTGKKG